MAVGAGAQARVLGPEVGPAIVEALGEEPVEGWSLEGVRVEAAEARLTWSREGLEATARLRATQDEGAWFDVESGEPPLPTSALEEIERRLAPGALEDPWRMTGTAATTDAGEPERAEREPSDEQSLLERIVAATVVVLVGVLGFALARRRLGETLAAALAMVLVAGWAWWADDAFITFHYVRRLLDGDGLVFNVGERVQGFTHPLWLFGVAAFASLTSIPSASLLLAAFCTTALLVLLAKLVETTEGDTFTFALALALAFGSNALLSFSTSGLEGAMVHAWVAATALSALRSPSLWPTVLLASLAACTRLDSVVTTLPFVAVAARTSSRSWRALAATTPLVGWLLFATYYFGYPLPNTFYAKTGEPLLGRIARGAGYLADWAVAEPLAALVVAGAIALGLRARRMPRSPARTFTLTTSVAIVAQLLYVLWVGGDYMRGRFVAVLPPLAAVAVALELRARLPGWRAPLAAVALLAVGLASMALPKVTWVSIDERLAHGRYSTWWGHLDGVHAPGEARGPAFHLEPVIAFHLMRDAFHADPRFVWLDEYGLTDPFVARCSVGDVQRPGHVVRAVPPAYFRARGDVRAQPDGAARLLARDPALVTDVERSRDDPGWPDRASRRVYDELALLTRAPLDAPNRLPLILRYTFAGPTVPPPPEAHEATRAIDWAD